MPHEHIKNIPVRREESHKGDYGKVFVIAGSCGMTGAAFLCSQGALKAGSGLVTCGVPASLNAIMEVKLTEVMTLPLPETHGQSLSLTAKKKIADFTEKSDVVAIGPGLGRDKQTQNLVRELIAVIKKPVVLDADGINAFEGRLKSLAKRKHRTVITPHPGEMARLTGKKIEDIQADRTAAAKEIAARLGAVVCLKGNKTVVADAEGRTYTNSTGNSGMASGGTGDVLTGMIASFIGQGVDDFGAAVSGVYLHGIAGDIAAAKRGPFGMTASDMLEYMHEAFDKAGI